MPAALDAGAPEGAVLTAQTDAARDNYDLPVAPFGEETPVQPLEGRVVRSAWTIDDADAAPAGIVAGYRDRLAEKGFEPVLECRNRACGGFDFRFGAELMPAPVMLMDTGNFAQLSMTAPDGRYASVLASRVIDTLYVQTVMVEGTPVEPPAPPAPAPVPIPSADADAGRTEETSAEASAADLTEPGPAAQPSPPGSSMGERIAAAGHAAIDGLVFTPGGTDLADTSAAALDRLAGFLLTTPERGFALVGHSDNVGGLEGNIVLSRRRAEAVREALIARGVAPDRLEAHGAGWLAPVATNETEAGRRLNRRVEIVAR